MAALKTPSTIALMADYYEVRDLLTGEVIGRISSERLRRDRGLARALKRHGFRLIAIRGRFRDAEFHLDAA